MSGRLARMDADQAMSDHVLALQRAGLAAVIVSARRPAGALAAAMLEAGVDCERVWIVDAVTPLQEPQPDVGVPVTRVGSPTLLELISLRVEYIVERLENPHVVICCMNTLARYNDRAAVEQFVQYTSARLDARGVGVDFILRTDDADAERLEKRVEVLVADRLDLAKA